MKPLAVSGTIARRSLIQLEDEILGVFNRAHEADPDLAQKLWYARANDDCRAIAKSHSVSLDSVIGVTSAVSPRMPWIWNLANAVRVIRGERSTAYRANEAKAKRILRGERPLDVLGGDKTRQFYLNISSRGTDEGVTVDTWALKVALGAHFYDVRLGTPTPSAYGKVELAYQNVGEYLNLLGCEVQAITWHQLRIECGFDDADWKVIDDFNPYS